MQYGNQGDAAVVAAPQYHGIFRNWKTWIAAAAVLAVASVGAVLVTDAVNTGSDQPVAAAEGTLLEEATPLHIAEPGITTQYFGYSGELFPEGVVEDSLSRSLTERQVDAALRSAASAGAVTDPEFNADAITRMLANRGLIPAAAVTEAVTDAEFNADAATRIYRDRLPAAAVTDPEFNADAATRIYRDRLPAAAAEPLDR